MKQLPPIPKAALCGLLSCVIDFIVIPQLPPMPEPIWISLMVLVPVALGLYLLGPDPGLRPVHVWVGLPVQYAILTAFAGPIRPIGHYDSWTYISNGALWPLAVTLAQFVVLLVVCRRKKWKR